jgi:hypothetical protein
MCNNRIKWKTGGHRFKGIEVIMSRNKTNLPIIGLIISIASFLLAFAKVIGETPDPILIRAMIMGEIVVIMVLLVVLLRLGQNNHPRGR